MGHVIYDEYTMEVGMSGTREEMIEELNSSYQDGYDVVSIEDWRTEAHQFFNDEWEGLPLWDKIDIIQNELGYDLHIYENDEYTFEMIFGDNAYEAARAVYYGEYRPQDEYVTLDGYENLISLTVEGAIATADDYNEEYIEHKIDENGW